jgi:urea-proton symporter
MGILVGSAVVPVSLSIYWSDLNAGGMTWGAIGGTAFGVGSWLAVASRYPGGLGNFFANTGEAWA